MAYFDTEGSFQAPAALGQIQGTPTIKVFIPKGKKNKKSVIDYAGPRELKDLKAFAVQHMPNFAISISGHKSFSSFISKAEKYGLPMVLVFSKAKTPKPLIKAMSTAYRRRLLIAEIRNIASNRAIIQQFGVSVFPSILVKSLSAVVTKFTKKITYNRLFNFLGEHALKKAVNGTPKAKVKAKRKKKSPDEL